VECGWPTKLKQSHVPPEHGNIKMIYFFVAPLLFSLANHMKHLTVDSETITVKCEGRGRISTSSYRGGEVYKGGAKIPTLFA